MKTRISHPIRTLALSAAALIALSSTTAAVAGDAHHVGMDWKDNFLTRLCARQFEIAQRMDMESFRDYDAETFRAVHDERAITIFASGAKFTGVDAIMTALASHFANREAQWTWTEVYRVVDGCNAAFILYETVYEIPRIGFRQHAYTGVTYSHDGHRWLAIADQGTALP